MNEMWHHVPSGIHLGGFVLLVGILIGCGEAGEAPASPPSDGHPVEVRGVWLTNVDSDVLDRRASIEEAMQFLAAHNFNVVFPVVWHGGTTLYPSAVMDRLFGVPIKPRHAGRDPLAEVVAAAHRHGLAVIPWFEFGFSARHTDPTATRILNQRPEWAARDTSGAVLTKNGFRWMNAYHPEVQDLLAGLVREVATTYDVDGIQGDDRLPAQPVEGGYSDVTVAQYMADHGQPPPDHPRHPDWMRWRADQLNAFAGRIYREVKAVDSTLTVSWAPSVYPWSYNEYLQEWPAWVRNGHADWVHPQVYRRDTTRYRQTLQTQLSDSLGLPASVRERLAPGLLLKVGDYRMSAEAMLHAVRTNRALGLAGEVFFFYEGLRENNDALADTLRHTVYRTRAQLPRAGASRP